MVVLKVLPPDIHPAVLSDSKEVLRRCNIHKLLLQLAKHCLGRFFLGTAQYFPLLCEEIISVESRLDFLDLLPADSLHNLRIGVRLCLVPLIALQVQHLSALSQQKHLSVIHKHLYYFFIKRYPGLRQFIGHHLLRTKLRNHCRSFTTHNYDHIISRCDIANHVKVRKMMQCALMIAIQRLSSHQQYVIIPSHAFANSMREGYSLWERVGLLVILLEEMVVVPAPYEHRSLNSNIIFLAYADFIIILMRQGFFKSVKNFFNSKTNSSPVPVQKEPSKSDGPRVVSFGGNDEALFRKDSNEEEIDVRYERIEAKQSWKQLGIKKDEVVEGEVPILVDNKFVRCKTIYGQYDEVSFILSNYQIMLKLSQGLVHFPLGKIEKLHKYTNNQNHYKLLIGLKDGRLFKFRINTQLMWRKIYDNIEKFAFVRVKRHFFAFRHFEANRALEENFRGWHSYDQLNEFKRMGVELMPHTEDPVTEYWSNFKILDNRDGKICPTYPEKIIVPSRITYDCLVRCSKFRSRSRMPALTYLYKLQSNKFVGLYRSSQSKVGVSNSRSPEDELMLRLIGNPQADPKDQPDNTTNCVIFDARNKMAAFGNKVAGKGYESQEFYPNCKVEFLNIPNIHAVRESYNKALKAALGEDSRFYVNLAESQWYDYVFLIIEGANHIVRSLLQGKNVLVHCSDGWDRTSQLCALAQILLDPYYRTIVGFQNLIDKDWIRFGHQFAIRMGQGVNNPTGEQKSPVFLQFLDCVSQLIYQYPTDFQFNYRYLQDLAEMSQTNLYGNFLCNCQLQLRNYGIDVKTVSMWSYFFKNKQIYANPFYFQAHERLHPSPAQKHFRFWKEHFLQFVDQFQDIYDIYSCKFTEDNLEIMYKHLKQEKNLLQEKINENRMILDDINKEIAKLNDQEVREQEGNK